MLVEVVLPAVEVAMVGRSLAVVGSTAGVMVGAFAVHPSSLGLPTASAVPFRASTIDKHTTCSRRISPY